MIGLTIRNKNRQFIWKIILYFFIVFSLFMCCNCANKKENINKDIQKSKSHKVNKLNSEKKDFHQHLYIEKQNNKYFIIFPISEKCRIDQNYNYPKLQIHFSPCQDYLHLPEKIENSLINEISLTTTKDKKIKVINIFFKEKVQYLISRPERREIKILISKSENRQAKDKNNLNNKNIILNKIDFSTDQERTLYIKLKADNQIDYTPLPLENNKMKFLLKDLIVPPEYCKLYNLKKFDSPIDKILLQNSNKGAILILSSSRLSPIKIYKNSGLTLKVPYQQNLSERSKITVKKHPDSKIKSYFIGANKTNSINSSHKNPGNIPLFPGMKEEYRGKHISIDLQDADIEHVLRLLAEVGNYNLILDQKVSGKISLKLKDVPWDQVLDLILQQKGLGMVKKGNILRIATADQLDKERKRIIQARKSKEELAPLHTKYIQVNYAKAASLEPRLKQFLSDRGKINFDARTNQIIVSDTLENLRKIRRMITKLDRKERQVLIEARVVYATDSFQRSLGINWGGDFAKETEFGGNDYQYSGDFAVNLTDPQYLSSMNVGADIAKLTGTSFFSLDARLELGESKGQVKTISSPRVMTLNNQRAEITQGTMLATKNESESGGTTTEYTEATLKLSVLPQITPDKKLILDLDISDDSPVPGSDDISTRTTTTKLIVNNEETVVIGGVQLLTQSEQKQAIPGLSKVPGLGWLFKNRNKRSESVELLIFIRPKII